MANLAFRSLRKRQQNRTQKENSQGANDYGANEMSGVRVGELLEPFFEAGLFASDRCWTGVHGDHSSGARCAPLKIR